MERAAESYELEPIGRVASPLADPAAAPKQGDEDAPPADLEIGEAYAGALAGLAPGDEVIVLTWLHQADRDVLAVHPRDDPSRPLRGVFATRSQDRPNPIGLHRATITGIGGTTVGVDRLEAIDGTPVLDVKPVLSADAGER